VLVVVESGMVMVRAVFVTRNREWWFWQRR
jgi:hypothetical protein